MKLNFTKFIKKINFLIFLGFLSSINLNATPVKSESGIIFTPDTLNKHFRQELLNSIYNGSLQLYSLKYTNTVPWVVLSDRNNNILYKDYTLNAISEKRLDFLEQAYVGEVRDNKLLLKKKVYNQTTNRLEYSTLGWIKPECLIISSYSLNSETGIPMKAMALISMENMRREDIPDEFYKYKIYNHPDAEPSNATDLARKFEVFYLIKKIENKWLVSRNDRFYEQNVNLSQVIVGWINAFHLTYWNHRLCLEPFSDKPTQKKACFFATQKDLKTYIDGGVPDPQTAIMKFNVTNKRPLGNEFMRPPILKNLEDGTKMVATMGTLEDNKDELLNQKLIKSQINARNEEKKNINIIFVMDATESMKPFYEPVSSTVADIAGNAQIGSERVSIRYGAILYRDYQDGKGYETIQLTANNSDFSKKLLQTRTFSNPEDKDLAEAQYNALINGLAEFNLPDNQSNILVLIGDAGNHKPIDPKQLTIEQVIETLVKYRMNIMTFQVNFGSHSTYSDFNSDARKYLFKSARKLTSNITEDIDVTLVKDQNLIQLYQREVPGSRMNSSYKLNFGTHIENKSLNELYLFGQYTYAEDRNQMPVELLKQMVVNSTNEYIKFNNLGLNMIRDINNNKIIATNSKYTQLIKKVICDNFELSESECTLFMKDLSEFSFIAYTKAKLDDPQNSIFIPVVLVSENEFRSIQTSFDRLKNITGGYTEQIMRLKQALVQETLRMLGNQDENLVLNKTLDEIYQITLGIPFDIKGTYGNLKYTKLNDLESVDRESLKRFISNYMKTLNDFNESCFNQCWFSINNEKFSYIRLSRFPGNE